MDKKSTRILRKIARIWSGVIITLGALMFIAEIIESQSTLVPPYPWFENLIPVTLGLAVVGLAVAWKYEGIGGAAAVGFSVVNLLLYIATGRTRVSAVIFILTPVVIPGILFLVCWRRSSEVVQP